jgi:hypothetical protein
MILELERAELKWFIKLLNNYSILMKSHVLNGTRLEDNLRNKIEEIILMSTEKLNIIPLNLDQAVFFIDVLEENFCSCPGCSLASVKHRKTIICKLYNLINDEGVLLYE